MLSVSEEVGGHVISHISNHIISFGWYHKGMQITFLEKLMNMIVSRRGQ